MPRPEITLSRGILRPCFVCAEQHAATVAIDRARWCCAACVRRLARAERVLSKYGAEEVGSS